MSRAGVLIGMIALLLPAGAHGQAPPAHVRQPDRTWPIINLQSTERSDSTTSATRPDFFLPRDSTAGFLNGHRIYRLPDDILSAGFVRQNSTQAYPSSLDAADRVVRVWLVRSLQDSNTGSTR